MAADESDSIENKAPEAVTESEEHTPGQQGPQASGNPFADLWRRVSLNTAWATCNALLLLVIAGFWLFSFSGATQPGSNPNATPTDTSAPITFVTPTASPINNTVATDTPNPTATSPSYAPGPTATATATVTPSPTSIPTATPIPPTPTPFPTPNPQG